MVEISFLKLHFANHPEFDCILCFSLFAVVGCFSSHQAKISSRSFQPLPLPSLQKEFCLSTSPG